MQLDDVRKCSARGACLYRLWDEARTMREDARENISNTTKPEERQTNMPLDYSQIRTDTYLYSFCLRQNI